MNKKNTPLENLFYHFQEVEDPRGGYSIQYPLVEILFLVTSAVISGYSEWDEIVDFGHFKLGWLRKYLPYKNGIPSHDTINRVLGMINHRNFEDIFAKWANFGIRLPNGVVINIDGKILCNSVTKMQQQTPNSKGGKQVVDLVSAWCGEFQMCLAQYKVNQKSNEITAIPMLLDFLEIESTVVTIDAIGCQYEIANKIVEKKGDYIIGAKGNQKTLLELIKKSFEVSLIEENSDGYWETNGKGHGRIEKRVCRVLKIADLENWEISENWKSIKTIIEIESERIIVSTGKKQTEKRYYISSLVCSAKRIGGIVREHWQIENQLHWTLDVVFKEDNSTKRSRNTAQNFGLIRKIGLNLLKASPDKRSMKRKINMCSLSDTYREEILNEILGKTSDEKK